MYLREAKSRRSRTTSGTKHPQRTTHDKAAHIADLCDDDKAKVAKLIEQVARKDALRKAEKKRFNEEREKLERLVSQLKHQNGKIVTHDYAAVGIRETCYIGTHSPTPARTYCLPGGKTIVHPRALRSQYGKCLNLLKAYQVELAQEKDGKSDNVAAAAATSKLLTEVQRLRAELQRRDQALLLHRHWLALMACSLNRSGVETHQTKTPKQRLLLECVKAMVRSVSSSSKLPTLPTSVA